MRYKEYMSAIHFSADDEVFHGRVIGINDLVTFEGSSVKELKKAFKEAVEDYLDTCNAMGKTPEKTYKGSFNVRMPVELHRQAALAAAQKNITLNEYVKVALSYVIGHQREVDKELRKIIETV